MGRKLTAKGAAKRKHLDEVAEIKEWGREQGWSEEDIGSRRVTNKLKKAYDRAHKVEAPMPENPEETGFKPGRGKKRWSCGFCETKNHKLCPHSIRNGASAPNPIVYCACSLAEHVLY